MFTQRYALWLVALNTLLHEIGVPVPLTPTVLVAGAGATGGVDPFAVIAVVVAATVAGNSVWFVAGRRYGSGVLKLLCRLSLSPDACVVRTEDTFRRWGWSSLVVGRFIPGVSLVAPPLAGALGMSWGRFIALSAAGAAIWALVVVGVGHAPARTARRSDSSVGCLRARSGRGTRRAARVVPALAVAGAAAHGADAGRPTHLGRRAGCVDQPWRVSADRRCAGTSDPARGSTPYPDCHGSRASCDPGRAHRLPA